MTSDRDKDDATGLPMERRTEIAGYMLVAISAITFSAKGIIAKLIYADGVDPVTLLAIRFSLALPLFWLTLYFYPSEKTGKKDLLILAVSGLLGLYGAALADFYGLTYIDASLERIILYSYPAMVVIWAALFFKERLTPKKTASIIMTYAGLMLALKVFEGRMSADIRTGALLVLSSALIYSFSYIITEALSKRVSGVKISTYTMTAATFAFLGTWRFETMPEGTGTWGYLVLMAVLCTYVPVLTIALGIKRIGAGRSAVVSFIGPVSTAVLAYIILGEKLGGVQILGMCVVLAGVFILSADGKRKKQDG